MQQANLQHTRWYALFHDSASNRSSDSPRKQFFHHYDIQSDSGGKVNILGDESIGHCDKKIHKNVYLSDYQDIAVGIYKYKRTVNGNNDKLLLIVF